MGTSSREQRRLHGLLAVLLDHLQEQVFLAQSIVFEYGTADALIEERISDNIIVHDYVYYCFTKSCKTLRAILPLLQQGLAEDAMTLLRGVYENYLHIVFVIGHPERIHDFVWKKIAVRTGRLQPALSTKGKRIPGKMEDTETGEVMSYGIGMSALADGSRYTADPSIHVIIHPYLSEHTHPNMLASGNYREDVHYSFWNSTNTLQAAFFAIYLSTITLAEALGFERFAEERVVKQACRRGSAAVGKALRTMDFSEEFADLPARIHLRLEELRAHVSLRKRRWLKPYPRRRSRRGE
jgi:hypothetical protein